MTCSSGSACTHCPTEAPAVAKEEKESCRTCPNRQQCHGKRPDLTQDTLLRLIRDTVIEVLAQQEGRSR
ncbi:MAG: hypothetical protein H6Q89_2280 [Myxococcaceae bacterium]|nr:hypothetical protein [Myxococcaceae bacterium]